MRTCGNIILLLLWLALPVWAGSVDYVPGQICCLLEAGYDIEEVNHRWGTTTLIADEEENLYLLFIDGIEDLEEFAELMNEDEAVDVAEANYILETPEAVRQMVIAAVGGTWDDYQDQSLTKRIRLDEAHLLSQGAGVTVAVLDTGVDPDHVAFEGRLSEAGFDCVDYDQDPWETANGLDDDGDDLIDEGYGHGTMVAGLIALVAPEATIMPVRVLDDEGRGTIFGIAKGIMYAISHGADLLNTSFGAPQVIIAIKKKLRVTNVHDVITIAGAGNRDQEEPAYHPASDSLALMITALDTLDVKADFADYNSKVLLAAPGVGVRSAYPGDEWAIGSGCSFATPLVTGEAALILSLTPAMDLPELAAILEQGVDPIYGIPGNEPYLGKLGSGRINLLLALQGLPAAVPEGTPSLVAWAWPNPSRGRVCLRAPAGMGTQEGIRVLIFDAGGRLVRSMDSPGPGLMIWRGRDRAGIPVSPGLYYARLLAGDRTATVSLTILR